MRRRGFYMIISFCRLLAALLRNRLRFVLWLLFVFPLRFAWFTLCAFTPSTPGGGMLLCDQSLFWKQHRMQPRYVGDLAVYVEWKRANPNKEETQFWLRRFRKKATRHRK